MSEKVADMERGHRQRVLNFAVIGAVFVLQAVDNVLRQGGVFLSALNLVKNLLLLAVSVFFLWQAYQKNGRKKTYIFWEEVKSVLALTAVFVILSVFYMCKNKGFYWETVEGIIRMLFPLVAAFAILNVMGLDELYQIMAAALVGFFVLYLCSRVLPNLSIESLRSISYARSRSPFESNHFSPSAMSFCLFFCYYRKNKILTVLSVVFTVLTFKRIMVLYAIFLLLFGGLVKKVKAEIPRWFLAVYEVGFFALSMLYIQLMLEKIPDFLSRIFGIDANSFSMGRSWLMRFIYDHFTSYGFMSSTVDFRSMEMDIPQFYVEMGILSVIATVFLITRLAKRNWYNFLIVNFCLLEMLTSHWIDIVYFWMVMYLTIGCIAYKSSDFHFKRNWKKRRNVSEDKNRT